MCVQHVSTSGVEECCGCGSRNVAPAYTFLMVVGPSAKSATTARVMAASGMPPQSTSSPRRGVVVVVLVAVVTLRDTVIEFGPRKERVCVSCA